MNCEKLTAKSLQTLVSFSPTLVSLSLFGCTNIFYEEENPGGCEDDFNPTRQVLVKDFTFEGFSRLRFLNLGRLTEGVKVETLLQPLASLTALDLSGIQLNDIVFLTQWKDSLASLVLYNMDLCEEHIQVIAKLRKLRSAGPFLPRLLSKSTSSHDMWLICRTQGHKNGSSFQTSFWLVPHMSSLERLDFVSWLA